VIAAGQYRAAARPGAGRRASLEWRTPMVRNLIYIVGLIVVVGAVISFLF
jgi:hypothetical protein